MSPGSAAVSRIPAVTEGPRPGRDAEEHAVLAAPTACVTQGSCPVSCQDSESQQHEVGALGKQSGSAGLCLGPDPCVTSTLPVNLKPPLNSLYCNCSGPWLSSSQLGFVV